MHPQSDMPVTNVMVTGLLVVECGPWVDSGMAPEVCDRWKSAKSDVTSMCHETAAAGRLQKNTLFLPLQEPHGDLLRLMKQCV